MSEHQEPLNVEQQIENLKKLGLIIEDENDTKDFLNKVSYFRLIKAYNIGLKNKNSNYNSGVTFNLIKGIYIFNAKFRNMLFSEIEKVEINLRCRLANYISCKYGIFGYKNELNFENPDYHKKFIEDSQREIKQNSKAAFIQNFHNNYNPPDLPFYALVETISFGSLSMFFKNLKNIDKKAIASYYKIGYTYLQSWFEHLSYVRNICAHYGRLYNNFFSKTPILYKEYTEQGIKNNRVFASLICLKHLLSDDKIHWGKFVVNIKLLLDDYKCADKKYLGFPEFWENYLLNY